LSKIFFEIMYRENSIRRDDGQRIVHRDGLKGGNTSSEFDPGVNPAGSEVNNKTSLNRREAEQR
jgi:hypothetical protein